MTAKNFTYSFTSPHPADHIFNLLLDVKKWWSGFYNERIEGNSRNPGDVFDYWAGDGAHYSQQKLVELVPGSRIAWLVTKSDLSFLTDTGEWNNTKICFSLSREGNDTRVSFTHEGLVPAVECYGACSVGWTKYLDKLKKELQ